jgi:hypothetical protein
MNDLSFLSKKDNKKNKNKEMSKPKFWTEEEDKILKEKAEEFKYKNWNTIATFIPGRTSIQCSARYRRIRPGLIKGAWDKEEDNKLLSLYEKYGKNWAAISKEMAHRTGKQIRDRFLNSLDSKFDRGKFTEEEDQAIIKYYKVYGNSWAKIAKKLKTRTGDMVKNRFYSSLKKVIFKNKYLLKKKRERRNNKDKNKIEEIHRTKNDDINLVEPKNMTASTQESLDKNEKMQKKEKSIFIESVKDLVQENDEISNQKNKIYNINSTNVISYDSNNNSIDNVEYKNNQIFCKNNSINTSCDYNENMNSRYLINNNENIDDNKTKNNNNIDYKLEENLKKENIKENISNYPIFIDDIGINSDSYIELNERMNNTNYDLVDQKDEVDERLEKLKNYQLEYKQNLKEQLDIISDLENIINQKLFSLQKELTKN